MDSMTRIIQVGESLSTLLVSPVVSLQHLLLVLQGWAELHLLQRSGESLLELGDVEQSYKHIREEGEELLRLTQVSTSLRGAGGGAGADASAAVFSGEQEPVRS